MTNDSMLQRLMTDFVAADSSDLHVSTDDYPYVRRHGALIPLEGYDKLDEETVRTMTRELVGDKNKEQFNEENELDIAITLKTGERLRINIYRQMNKIAWALRLLPSRFFALEDLGINLGVLENICALHQGLVLVTGATGSGKSTTLASIIDEINRTRECHVHTIEDPVEYVHKSQKSFVTQREIGKDSSTFNEALRRVLRQDPDVVMIGEMRDRETMLAALTLAETGHLTFGTLHTSEAIGTVTRIIGSFPAHEQDQIRTQLGASLQYVLCQQLVPSKDGEGRNLAAEVLVVTPAVRAMIRENKLHQVASSLQTGGNIGMTTMNASLSKLVSERKITKEVALSRSFDKEDMRTQFSSGY